VTAGRSCTASALDFYRRGYRGDSDSVTIGLSFFRPAACSSIERSRSHSNLTDPEAIATPSKEVLLGVLASMSELLSARKGLADIAPPE
jgi:hypothetical protein